LKCHLRLLAVYRLPAGKQMGILTHFQTKVNKKNGQKALFLAALSAVEWDYYKNTTFLVILPATHEACPECNRMIGPCRKLVWGAKTKPSANRTA